MSANKLEVTLSGPIAKLKFSGEKANSLDLDLLRRLKEEIQVLSADSELKVISLSSEGSGAFCAGASFQALEALNSEAEAYEFFLGFARLLEAIRRAPQIVLAKVQGKIVGGGVGLVAACDYVCALNTAAAKLSELDLGLGAFTIGPYVKHRLGPATFLNMSLDRAWHSAESLAQRGFYSALANTPEELTATVSKLEEELSRKSSQALRLLKEFSQPDPSQLAQAAEAGAKLSASLRFGGNNKC